MSKGSVVTTQTNRKEASSHTGTPLRASDFLAITGALSSTALLATSCVPPPATAAEVTQTATLTPTTAPPTATLPPPEPTATPKPPRTQLVPAYDGLFFVPESVALQGGGVNGGIAQVDLDQQSPGKYQVSKVDGDPYIPIDTYTYQHDMGTEDTTSSVPIAGFSLGEQYLRKLFGAEDSKSGTVGKLPGKNGLSVTLGKDGLWRTADGKVFNPYIISRQGQLFGANIPVEATDPKTGKTELLLAKVDPATGHLLDPSTPLEPAFKSPGDLAAEFGYNGTKKDVGGVELTKDGRMVVLDQKGNLLIDIKFTNTSTTFEEWANVTSPQTSILDDVIAAYSKALGTDVVTAVKTDGKIAQIYDAKTGVILFTAQNNREGVYGWRPGAPTSEQLVPKTKFTGKEFVGVAYPTQDLIDKGIKTGIITSEVGVESLTFDVKENLNKPGEQIVFARDPNTNNILLATRVNPNTGERVWNVVGLRDYADALGIYIGDTFSVPYVSDTQMEGWDSKIINDFNLAYLQGTSWYAVEKYAQNSFTFDKGDKAIEKAVQNGMLPVSGPIVYGNSVFKYSWVQDYKTATREQMIEILTKHVTSTMDHFKGKFDAVVVVNEARPPTELDNGQPYDYFGKIIGSDYVDIAFQAARRADPSAKLIYNETRNEQSFGLHGRLSQSTKDIVNRLKSKGLIDGVGIQMHIDASQPPNYEDMVRTLQSYGIPVYVTEFDVDVSKIQGTSEEKAKIKAEITSKTLDAVLRSKVCKIFSIWDTQGFRQDDGLPTPAYNALRDRLDTELAKQK